MTRLAPALFDRRYDDLVELGRSKLPALAPDWTDHNAHDPGITLIELLAWVAEAQLYSLGRRPRRDERIAYAALLGVAPHGTRPAHGLIWADRTDPASPAATYAGSRVIGTDAVVRLEGLDEPDFRPDRKILWAPGRIVRLSSRRADGSTKDLTASNDRGAVFLPFGDWAGTRDVLAMDFEMRGDEGLFPTRRKDAEGAAWVIGVRADGEDATRDEEAARSMPRDEVSVALVTAANHFPLPVLEDSSAGLLRTGVLVLDVSGVTGSPRAFCIEIQAPRGFVRPPRLLRIEPNVLPVTQGERIERELHVATGRPDFGFDLEIPGLCFEPQGKPPLRVEVRTHGEFREWTHCDRLADQGPDDLVYELDATRGHLSFGNGVNGRKPDSEAEIYVSYAVSNGADGNVAGNRKWTVAGFAGVFGVNPDLVAGGAERAEPIELRREARRHVKEDHALVSATDIESAALALPLLGVVRAWIVPRHAKAPQIGTVTLIAMRARPGGKEPRQPPETTRWLDAVRRRLAGRMPLGTRLVVAAPRYADFFVRAALEVEAARNPTEIEKKVIEKLADKLALVKSRFTPQPRLPGLPLARSEVAAWILGVEGVARLTSLELVAGRGVTSEITVQRGGLPRLDVERSRIRGERPGSGSRT